MYINWIGLILKRKLFQSYVLLIEPFFVSQLVFQPFIQEKKKKKKRRLLLQFFRGDRQLGFQFFRLFIGVNRLINIPRKIQIVKKSQLRLLISKVYVYG